MWKIAAIGFALVVFASGFFWLGRTFENRLFEDACVDMGGNWQSADYPLCIIEK